MENAFLHQLRSIQGQEWSQSPSPLGRWLRGTVREVESGALVVEFVVREEMTNPVGTLHGGAMAAIIDEMIGVTVFTLGRPTFYATVSLAVDFLLGARAGETVTATSRLARQGNTVINAICEVYNARGELLARGTSNLVRVQTKSSGDRMG